jgi:competence protein ComEA
MSRGFVVTIMLMLGLVPSARAADKTSLEGVININTASPEELRLLSGIGPARIRNILAYRQKHPFRTVEELARIKGVGRKTVRRLRLHLAVSGPTTAQKVLRPIGPVVTPLASAPAKPALRPAPMTKPVHRRGEPAHGLVTANRGTPCLPAP